MANNPKSKSEQRTKLRDLLRNAENQKGIVPVVPTLDRDTVKRLFDEGSELRRAVEKSIAPMTGRSSVTKSFPEGKSVIQHMGGNKYEASGEITNVEIDVRKPVVTAVDPTKSVQENALTMTREQCLDMYNSTHDIAWLTIAVAKIETGAVVLSVSDIGNTFPCDKYMRDHGVIAALLRKEHAEAWNNWRKWCMGEQISYTYDMCYNNVVPFMEKVRAHVVSVYGADHDFNVQELLQKIATERRTFFVGEQ